MNRIPVVRKVVRLIIRSFFLLVMIGVGTLLGMAAWQVLISGAIFFGVVLLVPFVFSALSTIGWLFYCVHRSLRKLKWRIVGVGLLVVWACASGWFAAQGDVWQNLSDRHLINSISIASAFALFAGAIAFSMIGRMIFNQLRILFTLERHKNVFWGLSDRDLLLARSIVDTDAYAQVQVNLNVELSYDAATRARMSDLADTMDAAWVFVDYSSPGKRCHLGRRHYLLSRDGHQNIAMANRIVESFCADEKAYAEKVLYVRAGDIDNEEMFSVWAQGVYEKTGHLVRVVVLKEAEMVARQFVEQYPPSALPGNVLSIGHDATVSLRKDSSKTLLLGFDHTGRAVLNANLCVSSFISEDGRTPVVAPVTVVDMLPERWERFACAEPEIDAHKAEYGIEFVSHKVGSRAFEAWLKERRDEFCRIVFCLPSDAFNIREALRIRELLIEWNLSKLEKELLVRVADPAMNELQCMRYDVLPLRFFGNLKDVYSIEFLDCDPVERIASVLNWQWTVNRNDYLDENATAKIKRKRNTAEQLKEQADDVRRLWEKASYYNRQASRASALGGLSFLRLLGVEWRQPMSEKDRLSVPKGKRRLSVDDLRDRVSRARDVMARIEHLRWMLYLFTQGIRTWDLKTPVSVQDVANAVLANAKERHSFVVPNSLAKQTTAFRAHAALIPFDELAELDVQLACAVNPSECAGLTPADFEGTKQPNVGGGRHPPSLQGKDYDMWAILPDAMDMAGIEFLVDDWTSAGEQRTVTTSSRLTAFLSRARKVYSWITREPADKRTEEERDEDLRKHLTESRTADRVRFCAKCAQRVYNNDTDLADVPTARACGEFLKSSIVECCQSGLLRTDKEPVTAFMFDDAISRHSYLGRMMSWGPTRLPYFFNPKNGLILPLYMLPKEARKKYREKLGIVSRRVLFQRSLVDRILFHRQPDFSAQVFSFIDETEAEGKKEKVAIVFRGTATLTDWWEDAIQCFGLTPPQFRLAADLVRAVCETTDKDILLIGHSEGGGEVQYALVKNSLRCWTGKREILGVTINSQRLSPRLLDELRLDVDDAYAQKHIINYRTGPDIVSGWKALGIDLLGSVYTIGKKGMFWGVKAHLIKEFVRVLDGRLALEGLNQVSEEIPNKDK